MSEATREPTPAPRWVEDPARTGAATVVRPVPSATAAALRRLDTAPGSVARAAAAATLAATSGEQAVRTGLRTADGRGGLDVVVPDGSWHDVLAAVATAPDAPAGGPAPVLLDLTATGGDAGSAELVLRIAPDLGEVAVTHRRELLDDAAAARLAGYLLRALELLATRPGDRYRGADLIDAAELWHQLEDLHGPRRTLPDRRLHEIVLERAREHPDRVAVQCGDRRMTYAELDERSAALARLLAGRVALPAEGVVAVVAERTVDWAAAVLAILRAGGAYLPVEPGFPPGRIATTLRKAGAIAVLAEPAVAGNLREALDGLATVEVSLDAEIPDGPARHTPVAAGDLAYLFFTSGSTGEPKGAMCEHAGLLNHVLAKIEDLGLSDGAVVAQTAPQCFDISLWQLVAAWVVGGRTVIVEQDEILDTGRFLDRVHDERVQVAQLVPSYLEVVVSHLEAHPRELPALRALSVTGEAIKKELARRWFARMPAVPLLNAYGLTETCDDTNHELLHAVPDTDRIPLGRAVRNVGVLVVDEDLRPVPLGAPGEIAFSGVQVGRGYVGDPELTLRAFPPDPRDPGRRLYRSGDRGRWLPGGTLDFLGRRDHQVKIRGLRIEIGEVENALLRAPGVRDAAAVVRSVAGRPAQLVAFCGGSAAPDAELVAHLRRTLPEYMVPSVFHRLDALPLTANGKVDRAALTRVLDSGPRDGATSAPPAGPVEERLAAAWADVLGVGSVGRDDGFFDLGGTSLSAVRLAIVLDRALTLSDITAHPVLADMAAVLRERRTDAPRPLVTRLGGPRDGADAVLVCFPHAGGNAVNFRPVARLLAGTGIDVHAVELPGHDPAAPPEPFAGVEDVAARAADEIAALVAGSGLRPMLWGQSSGTAFALATAARLGARGVGVERLFLAAQLPGTVGDRVAAADRLERTATGDVVSLLRAEDMFPGIDRLDAARADRVADAYRADCVAAHRHLADRLADPEPLAVPVTAVLAADDPSTSHPSGADGAAWSALAGPVDTVVLADGGHHFLRTRPDGVAEAVRSALRLPVTA